jgi:glycopeptide antibiotics resistance protein
MPCVLNSSIIYYHLNMFTDLLCSRNIKLSLSVLLLGVGVATVTDLQLNAMGSVLSLLAIITTCIAQIVSFQS